MWIVASVKGHNLGKVYTIHRKRQSANISAIRVSRRVGYSDVIGVLELSPDKRYRLFETYYNGLRR